MSIAASRNSGFLIVKVIPDVKVLVADRNIGGVI